MKIKGNPLEIKRSILLIFICIFAKIIIGII